MRLFFLTIPKPLKQYTLLKKTLSIPLIYKGLQEKLPDPSFNWFITQDSHFFILLYEPEAVTLSDVTWIDLI